MDILRLEIFDDGSGWAVHYGEYESIVSNWKKKAD